MNEIPIHFMQTTIQLISIIQMAYQTKSIFSILEHVGWIVHFHEHIPQRVFVCTYQRMET